MAGDHEILEGCVVDIACLRKYPQNELLDRARDHTRACPLEGHCAESGFGLVRDDGRVALLDPAATPKVLEAVRNSHRDRGIRLRAVRDVRESAVTTTAVDQI